MKTPFISVIKGITAAFLFTLSTLSAQAVLVVNSVATAASNPGIHLLEAEALDPNPSANREAVNAVVTVTLSNPSILTADSIEVESTFSLVRQTDGQPVDLQTDPVGTSVVVLNTFNMPINTLLQPHTMEAALRPVGALDPTVNYRIEASVRTRPEGGTWSSPIVYTSAWRQWVHFTNTAADDNSLNVKLFPGALALTDRQILRSALGQENFHAILPMTLHRYDIESVSQGATPVPLTFALRLLNSANPAEEVPLATPSLTVQRNLLARTAFSPPEPVVDSWTQGLSFTPAAGAVVDPTITYLLEVTVTSSEPDTTIVPAVPPILNSTPAKYLVLSGQLKFGGIDTTFTQLGNDPSPLMVLNAGVYSTKIAVAAQSGRLTTAQEGSVLQSRHYGDGVEMDVTYHLATGDATVVGGVTQTFSTSSSDVVLMGGLRMVQGQMRLGETGASLITGGVFFPTGLGVSTTQNSRRHQPGLNFANITLNNDFTITPYAMDFPPPSGSFYHVFCDRLPLRFRTDKIVWNMAAGTFHYSQVASDIPAEPAGPVLTRYSQELELSSAAVAPYLADPTAAIRPSNDAFLKNITATTPIEISSGTNGQALISVQFDLGPATMGTNTMTTHFPQGVTLDWSIGRFTLAQSVVTEPSYLTATNPITVSYKRDCILGSCTTSGPGSFTFLPTINRWKFTADGGIIASGNMAEDRLRWGTTTLLPGVTPPEGGPYAHQTSPWTEGAFHAPGTWLAGGAAPEVTEVGQRAQSLLHSGVLPDGSFERPASDGYRAGLGDYAGLNLRVGTAGAKTGRSILAGWTVPDTAFAPYDLNALSKYYVRASGVTGIHQAVALVPSSVLFYGFAVEMDGFRLAFRDGINVESKIGGSVRVKDPVTPALGFNLAFKDLQFSCSGLPGKMKLANEGEVKTLAYWGTDIVPLSMGFYGPLPVPPNLCPNINDGGFLGVGVETSFPSVTPQKLYAILGFLATGNLVTPANPLTRPGIDSRFVLPPNLQIEGAGGVPWEVTVTGHAYLNNPDPGFPGHATAPPRPAQFQRPEQGFLTFPATINVPWFEDVKVQFHASATSTATPSTSVIHVMGGWPSNPADGTGTGWHKTGATYFSDKLFDKDHLAFPADKVSGMVVGSYRNSGALDDYKPIAQKRWLGVVDFKFPLIWDGTQRKFTSNTEAPSLLVLGNVHRQLQSLTPSTAEITFGLKLDIPRLNTQSLVAAVKEGLTGVVADALSGTIKVPLGNGLTQLDSLLSQRVSATLEGPLNAATDPVADLILAGASPTDPALKLLLAGNLTNVVPTELTKVNGEIASRINSGITGISAALALVEPDGNGNRSVVSTLMRNLVLASGVQGVGNLDPHPENPTLLNTTLSEVLAKVNPDLAQAEQVMSRARAELSAAKTRLNAQVPAVFTEHQSDLQSVAMAAMDRLRVEKDASGWLLLSETAKRDRIRRIVQEGVMGSPVVPRFQFVVRQNIQDTNEFFRSALDSVLGQVNHVVRDVIKLAIAEAASQLTETRSPALGQLGLENGGDDKGKIAAINIEGYAQINDESLQELTINGRFEFNVPDSLKVQAHLHIKQYTADNPPAGCRTTRGQKIATVTVSAQAQCDWIGGPGTEVGVKAHFTMDDGKVVGFDGSFLLKGHIVMGPLTLSEIGVSAGFGTLGSTESTWAYVSGTGRGLMEGYEAAVGIFLGRTCNIEVLRSVDRFVDVALSNSKVDTNAAITGVYFYGEAWFPLNEVFGIKSSCFLTLKAGGGTGHFAFIGENEVGVDTIFAGCKFLYGVEGTVLCLLSARGSIVIAGAVAMPVPAPFTGYTGKPAKNGGLFGLATGLINNVSNTKFTVGGEGKFSATFGICPACKSVSKTLRFTWTINPAPGKLGFSF